MRAVHRSFVRRVAAVALVVGSVSCGDVVRQDRAPVLVVIDTMEAASGADPGTMTGFLLSDVQTLVEQQVDGEAVRVPTIFNDVGQATMRIIPKDAGNGSISLAPTPWNNVTINRYHIAFLRADGRNTPGVDVPFPVDGAGGVYRQWCCNRGVDRLLRAHTTELCEPSEDRHNVDVR